MVPWKSSSLPIGSWRTIAFLPSLVPVSYTHLTTHSTCKAMIYFICLHTWMPVFMKRTTCHSISFYFNPICSAACLAVTHSFTCSNNVTSASCPSGQVSDEQIFGNCCIFQFVIYLICQDGTSVNLIIRELAQIFYLGLSLIHISSSCTSLLQARQPQSMWHIQPNVSPPSCCYFNI